MTRQKQHSGRMLLMVCAVVGLGSLVTQANAGPRDDDLAKELPRIKPLEPAAALKSFRIHAGFRLEPVAVEPLVTDPVSVCYDADGRLYVVEMRGYPFPEKTPSGNVSRLEDRDGDGRFDTRTVFLDGTVVADRRSFRTTAACSSPSLRTSSMPRTRTATASPTSRR